MRQVRTAVLLAASAALAFPRVTLAQTPPKDTLRRICNALIPQTCSPPLARDTAADGRTRVRFEPEDSRPYFEFMVEKPARQKPGSATPRYPAVLRSTGMRGEVLAQFVVDTNGAVETTTLKFLRSTHELFSQAVLDAAPLMQFEPAIVGGRKVRQLVQQAFVFAISTAGPETKSTPELPASPEAIASARAAMRAPGFAITMRITIDSGGGRAPTTVAMKLTGSGKKVRQEMTGPGMPPVASIMNLEDSSMTVVMEQMGMAMIMKIPTTTPMGLPTGGTHTNLKASRVDIGPGESFGGIPSTRHKITTSSTLTQTLGGVTCSRSQTQEVEVWITSDPTLPKVMAEVMASMPKLGVLGDDPREMLRLSGLDPAKQSAVRLVTREVGARAGVTITIEFADYALLDVDAAKLTAPPGMNTQDMRGMDMGAMMGGAMGGMADRLFWSNFDTTATAGPSRATCSRK